MADKTKPTYRFKWSDYDLELYVQGEKGRADQLRREAEILTRRADQIDEDRNRLELALVLVEDDE